MINFDDIEVAFILFAIAGAAVVYFGWDALLRLFKGRSHD